MLVEASCPAAIFRGLNVTTTEQWALQYFESTFSVNAVKIALAAFVLLASLAFLFRGARMVKPICFISGFATCTAAVYAAVDAAVTAAPSLSATASCWLLSVLPLVAGLAGGFLAFRMFSLAFLFLGLAGGASFGYWLYAIVLHVAETGVTIGSYDLTFWLCLLIGSLVGAIALLKMEYNLLVVATAAAGAVGLLPAMTVLFLARIDPRFLWVLDASAANAHLSSPFVYGPLLGAATAFVVGVYMQRREKRERDAREYHMHVPLIHA